MKRLLFSLVLLSGIAAMAASEEKTVTIAPFALKISAPATWKYLPETFPLEQYEMRDKGLEEIIRRHKDVPIVSVIKPAKGSISTAIQIFVVAADGVTPKEFLASLAPTERKAFVDFRTVVEPYDTMLNGMKAAAAETAYTAVYSGGRSFATASHKWVISRESALFVIVLTGPPSALNALRADTEFILKSIRFDK